MSFVPERFFLTRGVGVHRDYLSSFEAALRSAGIETCNIVTVSSIVPGNCTRIDREEGVKLITPGQITFAVMARNATNEAGRQIAASIGIAQPTEPGRYGYMSEHHPFGETEEAAGDYAEDLAATMLATSLGIAFDADAAWDERAQVFKMSGQIVNTLSHTQGAIGHAEGFWTTVISTAVLLP